MAIKGMKRNEIPLVNKMAYGIAVSLTVMLGCGAIFAMLISSAVIAEDNTAFCVGANLLLSTGIGAYVATANQRENKLYKCLVFGCIYIVLLLAVTSAVFGFAYHGVWPTAMLILCGSMMPAILRKKRVNNPKLRRGKIRSC